MVMETSRAASQPHFDRVRHDVEGTWHDNNAASEQEIRHAIPVLGALPGAFSMLEGGFEIVQGNQRAGWKHLGLGLLAVGSAAFILTAFSAAPLVALTVAGANGVIQFAASCIDSADADNIHAGKYVEPPEWR